MNLKVEEERLKKESEEIAKNAYQASRGYEPFIKLLPLRKNIGNRTNPYFVEIAMPYMTVAGRLKMMADEHIESKEKYEIKPAQFVLAPDTKTLLCRMEVNSQRGSATAHAKVGINGAGVDASNPYENAETSALGRALGFLGYGVLGTGIASFEEVSSAASDNVPADQPTAADNKSGGVDGPLKIKIKQALIKRGSTEIEAIARVNALQNRDEAMKFLIDLGKADVPKEPSEPKPNVPEPKPETPKSDLPKEPEKKEDAPTPPTPPPADTKERVKTKELIEFKNLLVKKIGEAETRKILPKIKYQTDLETAKKEHGI